ncbi:hypothetical protein BC828DRAFT_226084 [Blastocladiella britannica]|nr:hypothetical protein BC828DRAFT_226084 [Blastocladiella britannica]
MHWPTLTLLTVLSLALASHADLVSCTTDKDCPLVKSTGWSSPVTLVCSLDTKICIPAVCDDNWNSQSCGNYDPSKFCDVDTKSCRPRLVSGEQCSTSTSGSCGQGLRCFQPSGISDTTIGTCLNSTGTDPRSVGTPPSKTRWINTVTNLPTPTSTSTTPFSGSSGSDVTSSMFSGFSTIFTLVALLIACVWVFVCCMFCAGIRKRSAIRKTLTSAKPKPVKRTDAAIIAIVTGTERPAQSNPPTLPLYSTNPPPASLSPSTPTAAPVPSAPSPPPPAATRPTPLPYGSPIVESVEYVTVGRTVVGPATLPPQHAASGPTPLVMPVPTPIGQQQPLREQLPLPASTIPLSPQDGPMYLPPTHADHAPAELPTGEIDIDDLILPTTGTRSRGREPEQ